MCRLSCNIVAVAILWENFGVISQQQILQIKFRELFRICGRIGLVFLTIHDDKVRWLILHKGWNTYTHAQYKLLQLSTNLSGSICFVFNIAMILLAKI